MGLWVIHTLGKPEMIKYVYVMYHESASNETLNFFLKLKIINKFHSGLQKNLLEFPFHFYKLYLWQVSILVC